MLLKNKVIGASCAERHLMPLCALQAAQAAFAPAVLTVWAIFIVPMVNWEVHRNLKGYKQELLPIRSAEG